VHHSARAVLAGLCAAAAVAATCPSIALAYDHTDYPDPIIAGHNYTYFVKEIDTDRQPIQGRSVTMTVKHGAGPDSSVAPSDPSGHATGPAGASASGVSGADGLVFFILHTSTTAGENDFVWRDDTYSGLVVVVGTPLGGESVTARPGSHGGAAASGGHHGASGAGSSSGGSGSGSSSGGASARARLPHTAMPPLAAAMLAFLLVWLLVPPVLRRHITLALPAALSGARPAPLELG
jgi:hypothetical protein